MDTHTLFITGASGYVGTMLVEQFSKRPDVGHIIGLDKEPIPESLKDLPNFTFIQKNTADEWQEEVAKLAPDIVIHTAWQIREIYGDRALTWKWNIDGSDAVFDYCFAHPEVKRLIYFSTVASYGAFSSNTLEHRFTEDEPFRKTDYLYAEEKRIAEEHLKERYEASDKHVSVALIRPAAITGPRGRFMRIRFGLQSALSGQLKGGAFAYKVISLLVSRIPATPKWLRQFIHEDDITDIVELLAFTDKPVKYEAFNACPPGPAVLSADMAKAVGKGRLFIFPWMMRIGNFFAWHLSRGKIPTGPGAWKSYSYPIAVDGSKITKMFGYQYQHSSLDAFYYTDGRYESFVPEESRRSKST